MKKKCFRWFINLTNQCNNSTKKEYISHFKLMNKKINTKCADGPGLGHAQMSTSLPKTYFY